MYTYSREFRIGRRADTLYKRIRKAVEAWYNETVPQGTKHKFEPRMTLIKDNKYMLVEFTIKSEV